MPYSSTTSGPWGLKPSVYLNGALWTGQVGQYTIASAYGTSIYQGDPVLPDLNGNITIAVAGDTNPVLGSFQWCEYTTSTGVYVRSSIWPANQALATNTVATAFVADDPNLLFDIQSNVSPGIVTASLNNNAPLVAGAGSAVSGQSGWTVSTTVATSATNQVKLIRFVPVPGNLTGVGYNNVLCLINNHVYKGGTGTLGY